MTLRLTVQRAAWREHVRSVAAAYGPALIPVVKGNGYGFGRPALHAVATGLADEVCVGSAHELHDVPSGVTPVVLTPALQRPARDAVFTVGRTEHVRVLAGTGAGVIVKLASSMRRYGATVDELPDLLAAVGAAGLRVHAFGLHLPLAGDDDSRLAEVADWLPHLAADAPLWLSHLSPTSFHTLVGQHPGRPMRIRVGTALWHGVPRGPFVHLGASVLDARRVRQGDVAGYRHASVPFDGTLVAIGAGSSAGVAPLEDPDPARRSPFHFGRERLTLLEPPHMHTSLVVVHDGHPVPDVGDMVDVQRPLIAVHADEVVWE
ncbi:MAG: alanine racemase [Actinomycetota bacterium]